ncbi:hypothetical protein BGZ80_001909 [Entomortierella chlamydospora]|uniref:Uncharacterized protein n=1 Tax=Entomortierella chlamydospora TaxID=101097 RepID=A0A9P6SXK9_9FUNG|nr:hypothetical protein BGZ80_001909 [Entomortierella chlamydospora]
MPKGEDNGNRLLCETAGRVIDMGYQCCLQLVLKDRRIIRATPSTRLIGENGHSISLADVRVGHRIRVAFDGVREVGMDCRIDLSSWKPYQHDANAIFPRFTDTGFDWGDGTVWDIKKDSNKILDLGRTVGYAMTDGSLSSTNAMVFLGSLYDFGILVHDLETLGMPPPAEPNFRELENLGSTYVLTIKQPIGKLVARAAGELRGGPRTGSQCGIPPILCGTCVPVAFVQAFLGGTFGGDGCSPTWTFGAGKIDYSEYQNLESLQRYLQFLAGLLKDGFGIECTSISFTVTSTPEVISGTLSLSSKSTAAFISSVGFRGCIEKNFTSAVILSMQNYRRLSDLTRAIIVEALIGELRARHGAKKTSESVLGILREVCDNIKEWDILNSLARLCNIDLANIPTLSKAMIWTLTQKTTLTVPCDQSVVFLLKSLGAWDRKDCDGGKYLSDRHEMNLPTMTMDVVEILPPVWTRVFGISARGIVGDGVPMLL